MIRMRQRNSWFYAFLMGFLLLVTLTGCRFGRRATPTPIPLPPNSQASQSAENLETYTVTTGKIVQLETFAGRVVPGREEDLFFRRSGQIADVYVEDGDFIEEENLIATLDNQVLEIDLESALLGLAIAKENLAQARENLVVRQERAENSLAITKLRLRGASDRVDTNDPTMTPSLLEEIRQLELRQAELNLEDIDQEVDPVLELTVKRAELAVERVKQTILEGQIEAPFSGEIRFINLPEEDEERAVSAYSTVARLVDTSQIKIELNLTRTQLESLREEMAVQISAATVSGRTLEGVISALPRPFGTGQGSLTEVSLVNPDENGELREGVTVGVDVQLQSRDDSLLIPSDALQEDEQLYFVVVRDGDQTERINVTVGIISTDFVEILAGLEAGQMVVAAP